MRLLIAMPRPGVQAHRDVRQAGGFLRLLPQPRLSAGVGQDVPAFGGADVGWQGDDGYACDQSSSDRQHGRGGRGRQHGHPVSGGDPLGHRRRRSDEITAAQHGAIDAHGVADIGAACDSRGVQRGQEHDVRLPSRRSAILSA
jgi:hypothetical protein